MGRGSLCFIRTVLKRNFRCVNIFLYGILYLLHILDFIVFAQVIVAVFFTENQLLHLRNHLRILHKNLHYFSPFSTRKLLLVSEPLLSQYLLTLRLKYKILYTFFQRKSSNFHHIIEHSTSHSIVPINFTTNLLIYPSSCSTIL